jgi:anti-sigma factor RsiW
MSCERYENELALYVEGDLPGHEVAAIERHLAICESCRAFCSGLEASQRMLKSLADEPIPTTTLYAARARVLDQITHPAAVGWRLARWGWAATAAAAVLVGALAIAWRAQQRPNAHPHSTVAVLTPPSTVIDATPVLPRSTPSPSPSVSPTRERRVRSQTPRLSPEDADQLARAVVIVSRIETLADVPREIPEDGAAREAPLARIATDNPNVVIYWQFDSNGG